MLPLFPLNTVLFPNCMLDLQLFEPRYLDMLKRCLKADESFGIVRIFEGQEVGMAASDFSSVGCEALIRDWHTLPNGLLGIRVEGGRRFQITRSSIQPDQLCQAEVNWLPACSDLEPEAQETEEWTELESLAEALGRHPQVAALGMPPLEGSRVVLVDRLAYLLPLTTAQKLQLLQEEDNQERLKSLLGWVRQLRADA